MAVRCIVALGIVRVGSGRSPSSDGLVGDAARARSTRDLRVFAEGSGGVRNRLGTMCGPSRTRECRVSAIGRYAAVNGPEEPSTEREFRAEAMATAVSRVASEASVRDPRPRMSRFGALEEAMRR
ncbi:hypothetical protein GCM10027271_33570 [Saccharopolyspora gloriosae]